MDNFSFEKDLIYAELRQHFVLGLRFYKGFYISVELCSSEPMNNGNLIPTDLTFGPQTCFSLILYIGYNRFWQ